MGSAPKLKIFDTVSATLNEEVVTIFSKQESFIKSELKKVETGLQMTLVDDAPVFYLHSASLNLLTKAEQILSYYLNEKGYEVLSSLENTEEEDETLLKRLQVTDDIPQQVVEKLLRRSKSLIKSYRNKHRLGSRLRKYPLAENRSKEKCNTSKYAAGLIDVASKDAASKCDNASRADPRSNPDTQPSVNATVQNHGTYDKSGEKSQTSATVSEKDADDGREEPLHQDILNISQKNSKPLRTYQREKSNQPKSASKNIETIKTAKKAIPKDAMQLTEETVSPHQQTRVKSGGSFADEEPEVATTDSSEPVISAVISLSPSKSVESSNNPVIMSPTLASSTTSGTVKHSTSTPHSVADVVSNASVAKSTAPTKSKHIAQPTASLKKVTTRVVTGGLAQSNTAAVQPVSEPITPENPNFSTTVPSDSESASADKQSPVKFNCGICTFTSIRKTQFERHMAYHQSNPDMEIHRCDKCPYSTTRKSCLKHHHALHHAGKNAIPCDKCSYQTFEEKLLKKHKRIVHAPGKELKRATSGKDQRRGKDKKEGSTVPSGPFSCPKCSYRSKSYYFYVRHLRVHTTETESKVTKKDLADPTSIQLVGEFKCNMCPYKTSAKGLFIRHMAKVHNESRPHICHECGSSFKRSDHLKTHLQTHLDEEAKDSLCKYKCKECGKLFKSPAHLLSHSATHSDEKPFKCDTCNSRFKTTQSLKKHIKCFHGGQEPAFPCPSCQMVFRTKSNLDRHKKTHKRMRVAVESERDVEGSGDQQSTLIENESATRLEPESITAVADLVAADYLVSICQEDPSQELPSTAFPTGLGSESIIGIPPFPANGFFIATDENNTPIPAEIIVQGTDGNVLAADIVTDPAAILQASQMAQTYLTLQRH